MKLIGDRMLKDLLEAERQSRRQAEERAAGLRTLLIEIGSRLNGESLQAVGRQDPNSLASWSASDWRHFFDRALKNLQTQAWSNGSAARLQKLENELVKAREQIRDLEQKLEAAQLKPLKLENEQNGIPATTAGFRAEKIAETPLQLTFPTGTHSHIINLLENWDSPTLPTRFEGRVSAEPLQWRRQSKALFILARFGLNARLELDQLIAATEGIKPGSGSLRRAINLLTERHIFTSRQLGLKSPQTRLILVRLSEEGRKLCSIFGWEPVESEWERLDRLHEGERYPEHTMAVLAFAMHARLRGHSVSILPEVDGPAVPDLAVEKNGEKLFVEVELGEKEHASKWRNLAALQGKVALCARDPKSRERLIGDCRLARLPGVATDMETLVRTRLADIDPATPLWAEAWD